MNTKAHLPKILSLLGTHVVAPDYRLEEPVDEDDELVFFRPANFGQTDVCAAPRPPERTAFPLGPDSRCYVTISRVDDRVIVEWSTVGPNAIGDLWVGFFPKDPVSGNLIRRRPLLWIELGACVQTSQTIALDTVDIDFLINTDWGITISRAP